jgi:flavin reductase (DIM6/NTAB) family NADH-FMN oxidoreductase RutF
MSVVEVALNQSQCSRVLYSNPVCFLCSTTATDSIRNVMTVSWLTATDNLGHFVCAVNRGRHSASNLEPMRLFVLCIATARQAALLRRVGSCSGRDGNKVDRLQIDVRSIDDALALFGVAECAAYLVCRVNTPLAPLAPIDDATCARAFSSTNAHHLLLHCTAIRGQVNPAYWDGRRFCCRDGAPPHLSFLGSQQFATIEPLEAVSDDNDEHETKTAAI